MFLAIKINSKTVFSSGKLKHPTDLLTSKSISIKCFYLSKAHKPVCNSSEKLSIITPTMTELDLLTSISKLPTSFRWEISIRYVILIDYDYVAPGDTWLTECRACCPELKFWHCIEWQASIARGKFKHFNDLQCAIIVFSCNTVLGAIGNPSAHHHLIRNDSFASTTKQQTRGPEKSLSLPK